MSSYPATYGEPRKGLAIASLVLGVLSILTLGCLGIGAITGLVLGIIAYTRANRAPQEYGGKGMALGGIITNALSLLIIIPAGIIAAIAIPSLLRARVSANESAAIGDIRTIVSAQAAYQSASGGYYGTPECLANPAPCIPNYQGPTFLDAQLASLQPKSGYQRSFHPGPAAQGDQGLSGLMGYAYTAVPVAKGQTGVRGFCGDASGVVCFTPDGSTPEVVDGACGPSCTPLR
jgi:type II secretory pathway pseudopilin PulG